MSDTVSGSVSPSPQEQNLTMEPTLSQHATPTGEAPNVRKAQEGFVDSFCLL